MIQITGQRLVNQRLAKHKLENASDVVKWLGAVQAQDYSASLWAIGLRTARAVQSDIEQAIAQRKIIRTWPMRGTLHFVPAADVRWMLRLLTPRVIKRAATRYKLLELNERTFARSARILTRALEGEKQLTRTEMYRTLQSANISVAGERGLHILSRLAQDGLICFASRIGKQPAFALLEEWVPPAKRLERDEALAKLAINYFQSHGPASLQDFAWWSGLIITEARTALEMVRTQFVQESINGRAYWFPSFSTRATAAKSSAPVHLLPVYDEFTVAYKDRSAVLSAADAPQAGNGIFSPAIVIDSRIVGTWKRELTRDGVTVTTSWFRSSGNRRLTALKAAADRYAEFLETTVRLQ